MKLNSNKYPIIAAFTAGMIVSRLMQSKSLLTFFALTKFDFFKPIKNVDVATQTDETKKNNEIQTSAISTQNSYEHLESPCKKNMSTETEMAQRNFLATNEEEEKKQQITSTQPSSDTKWFSGVLTFFNRTTKPAITQERESAPSLTK